MPRKQDALETYRKKRDFRRTEEPRGRVHGEAAEAPRFCVQKHAARRLHYDLRLEIGGVLKSWAVPKGPSLDPTERRLAVPTEDHPLEYGDFEGTIPEGEYGGGTVMLWDRGVYRAEGDPGEAYDKGRLRFTLSGEKLHGGFTLVRLRDGNWLLIKRKDAHARPDEDVTEEDRSVKTGRDLESIAMPGEAGPMPPVVAPALATLVDAPPEGERWLHEIKLDGYRILARVEDGEARLLSRSGHDWTAKMKALAAAIGALPDGIYDGEVVVYDREGRTRFESVVEAIHGHGRGPIVYAIFDLLYAHGHDLRHEPLEARKRLLEPIVRGAGSAVLRYCDHIEGGGQAFFEAACRHGLEGIVSKDREAPYPRGRSRRWLKIRCGRRQELVIAGYTAHTARDDAIGALVLGVYDDAGELRYAGRVGTGFSEDDRVRLKARLDAHRQKSSPFDAKESKLRELRPARYVEPSLVAEVRFTEWTEQGRLRHPVFLGLREDKPAPSVIRETPRPTGAPSSAPEVKLSHPDKVLYPEVHLTKRDLARHFERVAERMWPHLHGRPLTLVRCPDGAHGDCWFQKHPTGTLPDAIGRAPIREKEGRSGALAQRDRGKERDYLVVRSEAGIVALAQLGALEAHIWGSRVDRLERPDRMVFDLDPAPEVPFDEVVDGALLVRDLLEGLGLASLPLLTGGKGVHVVAPLERHHDFAVVKAFSGALARSMAKQMPDRFLATASKKARAGRVFVDYLRNGRGATAICPYSTRARPDASVAVPVSWAELPRVESAAVFTVKDMAARLRARDPWAGYFAIRQRLTKTALGALRVHAGGR